MDTHEVTLQRELNRLVEAELVYQRGLPPQATYTFKHALVSDSAYQSLLRGTRHGYHRRIAEVLEARFPETAERQPELVAHHYTEGGLNGRAVDYWHRAGRRAVERSANVEAISHLTRGLQVLKVLPETAGRDQEELSLLITLGPAYIATTGYIASEVEDVYTRAHELCRDVEAVAPRFAVLSGLRRFYQNKGDLRTTREIGEELLTLAQSHRDPMMLLDAYWSLSGLLFQLGELVSAQQYLNEAVVLFESQHDRSQIMRHGTIPGVHCLSWLSLALWMLGYPDQALQRGQEALTLSRQYTSSFALQFALHNMAVLHQYRQERCLIQGYFEERQALQVGEGEFVSLSYLQGWMLLSQGEDEQGLSLIRNWLNESEVPANRQHPTALLAESYLKTNQTEAGINLLTEGFALVEHMGSCYYEAEFYRLKGQLLLQQSSDNHAEAETCFHQALDVARHQCAKSFELRAATSLARLWQQQNKRQDACDLLAPVYEWFTEGLDTVDLKEAKILLGELAEG